MEEIVFDSLVISGRDGEKIKMSYSRFLALEDLFPDKEISLIVDGVMTKVAEMIFGDLSQYVGVKSIRGTGRDGKEVEIKIGDFITLGNLFRGKVVEIDTAGSVTIETDDPLFTHAILPSGILCDVKVLDNPVEAK